MANSASISDRANQGGGLSIARLSITGGITTLAVFIACWIGAQVFAFNPTHAFITLFTTAKVGSTTALLEGGAWSLVFGAFTVGLFGLIYNLTASIGRR
jgi:hypothetical protein